jgi:hypothetical protein
MEQVLERGVMGHRCEIVILIMCMMRKKWI